MPPHLRIARPTDQLDVIERFYVDAFAFERVAGFEGHDSFSGVMLALPGSAWHLEFTAHPHHIAGRAPTEDNLLVLYLPGTEEWKAAVARAERVTPRVKAFNSYWDARGATFEDPDGYRVVLQNAAWPLAS